MDPGRERFSAPLPVLHHHNSTEMSRATSPGGEPIDTNGTGNGQGTSSKKARSRPRTYPYLKLLPYETESEADRQQVFDEILKHLYIAVEAGDFTNGAVHWTKELRAWLGLKFDPTREQRIKLVKLYYELALAPGVASANSERFASMFMFLTKYACFTRHVCQCSEYG